MRNINDTYYLAPVKDIKAYYDDIKHVNIYANERLHTTLFDLTYAAVDYPERLLAIAYAVELLLSERYSTKLFHFLVLLSRYLRAIGHEYELDSTEIGDLKHLVHDSV